MRVQAFKDKSEKNAREIDAIAEVDTLSRFWSDRQQSPGFCNYFPLHTGI